MKLRSLAAALVALATASATGTEPADSLAADAATFIASNFKLGFSQAMNELSARGMTLDSAKVMEMVIAQMAQPYNRQAHTAAYEHVMRSITTAQTALAEEFLAEASARPGAVAFRYVGSLPDGSVFDAIAPDEEAMTARPADLVPGMTEGLQLMKAGGRYILTIPSELAYGSSGAGTIPPDTPIRFEIDFIEILDK